MMLLSHLSKGDMDLLQGDRSRRRVSRRLVAVSHCFEVAKTLLF